MKIFISIIRISIGTLRQVAIPYYPCNNSASSAIYDNLDDTQAADELPTI